MSGFSRYTQPEDDQPLDPVPMATEAVAAPARPGADTTPVGLQPLGTPPADQPPADEPRADQAPAAAPAFPEYGAYTPQVSAPPPPGDPLRGLLAGLGAAVLGAVAWGLLVYVTKWELGIVAVLVGYAVGWVVHRVGRTASVGVALGAAALAALGILLGFVLGQLAGGMAQAGIGFMDAVDIVTNDIGWASFIGQAPGDGLGWAFLAIGAFAAFRVVAQQRALGRRR